MKPGEGALVDPIGKSETTPRVGRGQRTMMITLMALWASSVPVDAEEISVQAIVSRRSVPLNGRLQLSLQVNGTQQVQAPTLQVDGFQTQYLGPSTQISVVNGQVSSSIAHNYVLIAQREGTLTIGPISVDVDGKTFQTQPIEVEVLSASAAAKRPARPGPAPPIGEAREPPVVGDALQLQLGADRTQAYLNQAIRVKLQLLVGNVAVRGIEMPTLQAEGFLVKPIGQPRQSNVVAGGGRYTLLEFETVIIPIRTGQLSLGPASIDCQLVQRQRRRRPSPFGSDPFEEFFERGSLFDDFFGRATLYPVTVNAEPVTISVLPLPAEDQPKDFAGAVGQFSLEAHIMPTEVSVGDPVTVTMTVRGDGNFDSVSPPTFSGDLSRFKVYEPQQRTGEDRPAGPRQKVFEQVLIPQDPSVREIPAVRFSYLDPDRGEYETLTQGPIALRVTPSPIQQQVAVSGRSTEPEFLGRDIIYIKEELGSLRPSGWTWYRSPWWLLWYVGAVAVFGFSEWARGRRAQRFANPAAARASGAMKRAWAQCQRARKFKRGQRMHEFYEAIFRAVQCYVGDRFNLPSKGLTKAELEQFLRPRGAPEELIAELAALFDRCDAARFAGDSSAPDQMDATLQAAESTLRQLEKWRPG